MFRRLRILPSSVIIFALAAASPGAIASDMRELAVDSRPLAVYAGKLDPSHV